jgi:hypothetical protein
MKKRILSLSLCLIIFISFNKAMAQTDKVSGPGTYLIMENYYKIKWGYADEFISLWKKNHYPLLKKTQENGEIISVSAEKPILHSGEDARWDFKVTIVWKNADLAVGKEDPTLKYKAQLYRDIAKLDKDEQYRFSLLLSHWDIIIENINLN